MFNVHLLLVGANNGHSANVQGHDVLFLRVLPQRLAQLLSVLCR